MTSEAAAKQLDTDPQHAVIIGAGPAGLTAAWELQKKGVRVTVCERDSIVGGISRTETYKGYRYDIGGHRFFSKIAVVREWWEAMLSDQFIIRPRLSRIYYNGKFFDYPLRAMNALSNLGLFEAFLCGLSYLKARLFPYPQEKTLQQWVSNRFGRRLFNMFFKTYTEKVWGMRCDEISADWAAQRIKNLDLLKAVKNALLGNRFSGGKVVTSLIDEFHYPRLGPGQMWERVANKLAEKGDPVLMKTSVEKIHHEGGRVVAVTTVDEHGERSRREGNHFVASMPIRELVRALDPPPPNEVLDAAGRLRYRDFLTVGLIVANPDSFPDNWIYIHSPEVKVGRIQNFKAWSPDMVPDPGKSSLGLEYFVQEGDEIWSAKDEELVKLGGDEVAKLGLVKRDEVVDGCVIRMPKAYPVYDDAYQECVATIREYLEGLPNLYLIGRNGQHRYNNQDHSMLTAMYAAKNILGEVDSEGKPYDIWTVNTEDEYHEEGSETHAKRGGDRLVPARANFDPRDQALLATFERYDSVALGLAMGILGGIGLFLATSFLLLKGGDVVGPNLALLANYLVGFKVSWAGAVIGLFEGGLLGFLAGSLIGTLLNLTISAHTARVRGMAEADRLLDIEGAP